MLAWRRQRDPRSAFERLRPQQLDVIIDWRGASDESLEVFNDIPTVMAPEQERPRLPHLRRR